LLDGEAVSDELRLSYGLPVGDEEEAQQDGDASEATEEALQRRTTEGNGRESALAVEDMDVEEQTSVSLQSTPP